MASSSETNPREELEEDYPVDERMVARAILEGNSKTLYWSAQGPIEADNLKLLKVSLDFTDGSRLVRYLSDMERVEDSSGNLSLAGHQNRLWVRDDVVNLLVDGRVYVIPRVILTVADDLVEFFEDFSELELPLDVFPSGFSYSVNVVISPSGR